MRPCRSASTRTMSGRISLIVGIARLPSVRTSRSLTRCLGVEQATDVLGDLRDVLDDEQARLITLWHRADDTTRVGGDHPEVQVGMAARVGSAADGEEDRALAARAHQAHVVAAGHGISTISPASSAKPRSSSAETRRSRSRRTQRRVGSPWPPSSKIVVRVTLAARRVVLRRAGLGHDRAGLRIEPRPFEHDPAVEAGEVLGIGQPDVDDGEPARSEVIGQRPNGGALGGPGRQDEQRVERDERQAEATGIGQAQPDDVGLDEGQPVLARGPAWPACRARSSIAGSRSTPVTAWPASASGIASRPVPTASSRIGPSARSASARYRSRSPGSSVEVEVVQARECRRGRGVGSVEVGRARVDGQPSQRTPCRRPCA